jgi:predicted O-linked N-acetylglucosamine transferase (SPINDLY family)
MFDAWAATLRGAPSARLLLKFGGLEHSIVQANLRREFESRGVAAERILFEGWSPAKEILARYHEVDIALDTQPYSGGVTTCEALWMGVPVITCPGKTFAGRHSTSHLTNAGYPEFIAPDLPAYIDLAVSWANRLNDLNLIRSQIREKVRLSPLCDAPIFARDFLTLLQNAFHLLCRKPAVV